MPRCPLSSDQCFHPYIISHRIGWRKHRAICLTCNALGPIAKTGYKAEMVFWDQGIETIRQQIIHQKKEMDRLLRELTNKEKPMYVPYVPTYDEGYKHGVAEACRDLIEGTLPGAIRFKDAFDMEMANRRKKLLTKKKTWWVNLYRHDGKIEVGDLTGVYEHTEEGAKKAHVNNNQWVYLKTIPLEIEAPL